MKSIVNNKIILIVLFSIFFSSCSRKNNNFDFDLSNLPKPKPITKTDLKNKDLENKQLVKTDIKRYIKDLIALQKSEEISSKIKLGKKDPFSERKLTLKKLNTDLKLDGFLNTEFEKYVFVNYLGNVGTISEESIGGVNTNLLPDGAKVKDIDPKNMKLIIDFEKKDYVFELYNLN